MREQAVVDRSAAEFFLSNIIRQLCDSTKARDIQYSPRLCDVSHEGNSRSGARTLVDELLLMCDTGKKV